MNSKTPLPKVNVRKSAVALALMATIPSIYIVTNISGGALGQYNRFSSEILLRADLSRDALLHGQPAHLGDYVTEHEWAHFIWRKRKSPVSREIYCRAVDRTGYSPTEYGKTNCAENFAEVYAGLVEGVLEYDPKKYQHFSALNAIQRFESAEDYVTYPK